MDLAARIAAEAHPEGIRCTTRMLQLADNRQVLPGLAMPVMVITAGRDPIIKPAVSQELRALTPAARHVTLPGLGHAPYLEDPAAYNAVLAEFLETGTTGNPSLPGGS